MTVKNRKRTTPYNHRKTVLICLNAIAMSLIASEHSAFAAEHFNLQALEFETTPESRSTLQQFVKSNGLLPGTHRVDIYLNGNIINTRDVSFVLNESKTRLLAQMTKRDFAELGVNVQSIPELRNVEDNHTILNIEEYVQQASVNFHRNMNRLDITIPQAALQQSYQGYIDPQQWDDGVPAWISNYNLSGAKNWYENGFRNADSLYLNWRNGLNLGAWRLRNESSYTQHGDGWKSINTYLQRDIKPWRSKIRLGDSFTNSDIFDGFQFRGVHLESDTDMLPYSQQGFAPVVRGVAKSNAQVTIRQNGYVIYQNYVAPGPFEIRDLNAVVTGVDMEVTVQEADGSKRSFMVASSSLPIMQRDGQLKYSFSGGKYRSNYSEMDEPGFGQLTLAYGLPFNLTGYGGALASNYYRSMMMGLGIDFGSVGSVSFDGTLADSDLGSQRGNYRGMAYRAQYAKRVESTGTSFTLASYRYSTQDYYSFGEAIQSRSYGFLDDNLTRDFSNKRSRVQLNMNQSLGSYGSLYLSGYQQDYWHRAGYQRTFNAGISTSINRANYSLSYNHTQTPLLPVDRQVNFTVSVALNNNQWGSYGINNHNRYGTTQEVGLSGSALENNNLNYNLQQSYGRRSGASRTSLSSVYRGGYGTVGAGYSNSYGNQQVNYNLQGGVVAHQYGVTLSQPLNETVILVHTPDSKDIRVEGAAGNYTDIYGNAIVPYATAYRKNRVAVNTQSAGTDVDIESPVKEVIPTSGAVVLADFKTRIGKRVLLTLIHNGKPLPFGASVSLADTGYSNLVGESGEVYLSGVVDNNQIVARWGHNHSQQCKALLNFPPEKTTKGNKTSPVSVMEAQCL